MKIQAYRRKKPSTHELGGKRYKFLENDQGDFVCDVQESDAVRRFLSIADAFRPYEDAESLDKATSAIGVNSDLDDDAGNDDAPESFVLTNGQASIDLSKMEDPELKQFVKDQNLQVDGRLKGDNLRSAIKSELTKVK
jgi:hypothetical protein